MHQYDPRAWYKSCPIYMFSGILFHCTLYIMPQTKRLLKYSNMCDTHCVFTVRINIFRCACIFCTDHRDWLTHHSISHCWQFFHCPSCIQSISYWPDLSSKPSHPGESSQSEIPHILLSLSSLNWFLFESFHICQIIFCHISLCGNGT